MTYEDQVDGVVLAMPVVSVWEGSSVTVRRRRVQSHYGAGGVWLIVRECGRQTFAAVRSPRGWEMVQ